MAEFKINGVAIAAPKTFKVNILDLDSDNSARNAKGVLLRDRLRIMRKIECEWGPLTGDEIKNILQAVSATGVPVNYPDPLVGGQNTLTMYAGDRVAPAYDFSTDRWQGLSFNLTEL
ncbi:DUF6711 family protein [Candidatus Clostridium stratigraminis]|uniref:DUF6711 family protein n=1 Tax=Candidatus Clostridium stratigraminis TaxID=3381661 RepID=A0ABW8SYH6_9CLOT